MTYLLLRYGIVHQHQVRQPRELAQDVNIGELGNVVRRQDEIREVRHGRGERRLNDGDAVPRKEECRDPRREGEVTQDLDIVVGEVDGIVGLALWSVQSHL